jgi:hypothetical protein
LTTLQYTETLEVTTCWCGIHLAVPDNLLRHAHQGQTSIYCPLGHQFSWKESARSDLERAQKRLAETERRLAAERDLRADTERRLTAQKGQTTKARKRAAAALCPCCNRSFVQLRRHMEAKHPDYDPAKAGEKGQPGNPP